MPEGVFSTYANDLLKGDLLDVMPPIGKFILNYIPLIQKNMWGLRLKWHYTAYFHHQTTLQTELTSNFTTVYGNRNRQSIIFKEELEALKNRYMNRFRVIYILSGEKPMRTSTSEE